MRFSLSSPARFAPLCVHAASTNVHRIVQNAGVEAVEEPDRVLASVSCEVTVMAIDHGQAGAREGGEGVPEIVDASARLDPGGNL